MFNGRQSPTMQSELDVRLGKVVIKISGWKFFFPQFLDYSRYKVDTNILI